MNISAVSPRHKNGLGKPFDLFVLVFVLLLVFILAARTPIDSDMWWHLRAGQETWQTAKPMLVDNLSTTRFGSLWINHSWLSELGMYLIYDWGGSLAIGGVTALLAVLCMFLVYITLEGSAIVRAFLLIFGSAVAAVVWAPRPQLISLCMMALVGYLLYQFKWKNKNRLWLLPVVFIFWANLHGGFPLGLMLIGCLIAGEFLNHMIGNMSNVVLDRKRIFCLVIWGSISVAALAINANGLKVYIIPFQTVGVKVLQDFVSEWASPDFHQFFQQPFIWLLLAFLASVGFSGKRMDVSDFLVVSLFIYLALVSRRNFSPFAIVVLPALSRNLSYITHSWGERIPGSYWEKLFRSAKVSTEGTPEMVLKNALSQPVKPGIQKAINLSGVAVLAFAAIIKLYVVANPIIVDSYIYSLYPVKAVDWIRGHQPSGTIFNEYNWGGYLTWVLSDYPVFVDGRTDLYGDEILGQWITVIQAGTEWQTILDRWKVRLILIEPGRPLANMLSHVGWTKVYQDSQAVIFVR